MALAESKHKGNPKGAPHHKSLKRKRGEEDLDALEQRVRDIKTTQGEFETFADVPLSRLTAQGLEASHFKKLTDIQARGIPFALKGSDILGAAKTGSGKTLAFLVPVLENLYRRKWTELDGLGALILSPTRELAIQIFEVLRKVGRYHTFSAGLVIGGKSLQEEQERLGRMNILVCTPGRMLQHMDQTSAFEIDNLQMLVLDEADRILDMGFQNTVDAIVQHLPKSRQTLLFSATQTKKVSDLARLSLKDPEYVAVHEAAQSATPSRLQQNYIVTPLPDKLDTLWSFLRSNLKSKTLVFASSGKQVRFMYEAFRHMQPGIPLLHIHGRQKQTARLDVTKRFSDTRHSCLFATDVAARGLDIPAVDWVVQLDCPEDADTYIHRVGRTARYERDGRAVLFLEPTEEEGMLKRLEQKKVSVEKINVRQNKQQSVKHQLQNMCFKDPELKYLGQKAFVSYVRSVHVQKDKEVFRLNDLPLEEFAASMGLPGAPKIKFLKGDNAKQLKNAPRAGVGLSEDGEGDSSDEGSKPKRKDVRTKYDRMFERRNQDVLADHYAKLVNHDNANDVDDTRDANEDNDFLSVRRRLSNASSIDSEPDHPRNDSFIPTGKRVIEGLGKEAVVIDSKRKEKLLKSKKRLLKLKDRGKKLVFDDEGNAHEIYELEDEEKFKEKGPVDSQKALFLDAEQERLRAVDLDDKAVAKAKKKEKREKQKARDNDIKTGESTAVLPLLDENVGEDLDHIDWSQEDTEAQEPTSKRPKKWFEDDSDGEPMGKRHERGKRVAADEATTLEDLEDIAAGLLK